jgi:hypothetical protein
MTADEIAAATRHFRERVEALLSPAELACYDAYLRRLEASLTRSPAEPLRPTPDEQAALALIEGDSQARGLRAQLDILTRVDVSRQ